MCVSVCVCHTCVYDPLRVCMHVHGCVCVFMHSYAAISNTDSAHVGDHTTAAIVVC
jgi:hypothetical protein